MKCLVRLWENGEQVLTNIGIRIEKKHNDYWGLFCKLIPHSLMSDIVQRFLGEEGYIKFKRGINSCRLSPPRGEEHREALLSIMFTAMYGEEY